MLQKNNCAIFSVFFWLKTKKARKVALIIVCQHHFRSQCWDSHRPHAPLRFPCPGRRWWSRPPLTYQWQRSGRAPRWWCHGCRWWLWGRGSLGSEACPCRPYTALHCLGPSHDDHGAPVVHVLSRGRGRETVKLMPHILLLCLKSR